MQNIQTILNKVESLKNSAEDAVHSVVIMPIYGQAAYLCEALTSVLAQKTRINFRIILIDDACADPSTIFQARKFCHAYKKKIHYIRSAGNGGLSKVRNTGVNYALEQWPEVISILFFDGDDRMHPLLLERSYKALCEVAFSSCDTEFSSECKYSSNSENLKYEEYRIGWVFEDPDHFGVDGYINRVHEYSPIYNMAGCSNTSSSMILADVFRSGLRYSETMLQGGEDWHFWLGALKLGYRGHFVPHLGFQYRRRPGSMASNALKRSTQNFASIRLSHPELFNPTRYLTEEIGECPRYTVFCADSVPQHIAKKRQISFPDIDAFVESILRFEKLPTSSISQYVLFTTGSCLNDLHREGFLDWFLWRMETQIASANLVTVRFLESDDSMNILSTDSDKTYSTLARNGEFFGVAIDRLISILRSKKRVEELASESWYRGSNVSLSNVSGRHIFNEFEKFIAHLCIKYHSLKGEYSRHKFEKWKPFGLTRKNMVEWFFDVDNMLPIYEGDESVVFVVREEQLKTNELVEKQLKVLASFFRAQNIDVTLLMIGRSVDRKLYSMFDRILSCHERRIDQSNVIELGSKHLIGMLLPFSTVVCFGTTDFAKELNELRRQKCAVHLVFIRDSNDMLNSTCLVNCFKVFTSVYCSKKEDAVRVAALGVSDEQIARDPQLLLPKSGSVIKNDASPVF